MVTEKLITSRIELINTVLDAYQKDDVELSHDFFDFKVKMVEADILKAYAELQEIINADAVVRIENGKEQEELIPDDEFLDIYEGSCENFLLSFNGQNRFLRMNDEEILDFIW